MSSAAASGKGTFASRVAIVGFAAVAALLVFALRHVLLLAFGAILIAVGLRGVAAFIERRTPLSKTWSIGAAILIVLAILGGLLWLLGAQIADQGAQLMERLPEAWRGFRERVSQSEFASDLLGEIEGALSGTNSSELGAYASRIGAFTMSAAGATLEIFLVIVAAIFFALSPDQYCKGALMLAPKEHRPALSEAFAASTRALRRWLLGTLISMVFLAVVVSAGLWALGVPAFLALGVLCGLAQFVPLVGPVLAAAPGILLAFTAGPETALWAGLLYFVTSQVEANLITPLIQQRAVSLPPAMLLFGVIAGALLLGPLGALFATPLIVVICVFVVIFYVRGVLGDEDAKAPGD